MEINEKKDALQQEWANLFLEAGDFLRFSMILATGVGKSRLAMLILEALNDKFDDFLIVVDSTRLRDFNWKEDFTKWGKEDLFKKVTLQTYQAVYKWTPKYKDLSKTFVICDEVDFAIGTPKYGKFFNSFSDIPMLGLTGYITESKRKDLNNTLPILLEYPFEEAVKDGIINDIKFIFVKFDLDKNKNGVEVKYKKDGRWQTFKQSENAAYDYTNSAFIKSFIEYNTALVQKSLGMISEQEFIVIDKKMKALRNRRMQLLHKGIASKKIAKRLINTIVSDTENKVAVFSKITAQSSDISEYTYHGKNTKQVNDLNYEKFNSGEINTLGICAKINRGVNMVGLNNIILESYDSSDTIIRQRIGRAGRLEVSEVANIYILLPYYMKKEVEKGRPVRYVQARTQMVKWAETMLHGYDLSKATVIDYRILKDID